MRLTREGEYAVRTVLYLVTKGSDEITRRRDVSEAMEIPHDFLGKIAQKLAHAKILEIRQGPKGGYRLIPSPDEITILDVIEAVEGPIVLNPCLIHPSICRRSVSCGAHKVWLKARTDLRQTLGTATFRQMADGQEYTES